jgi:hypothetical protein
MFFKSGKMDIHFIKVRERERQKVQIFGNTVIFIKIIKYIMIFTIIIIL